MNKKLHIGKTLTAKKNVLAVWEPSVQFYKGVKYEITGIFKHFVTVKDQWGDESNFSLNAEDKNNYLWY